MRDGYASRDARRRRSESRPLGYAGASAYKRRLDRSVVRLYVSLGLLALTAIVLSGCGLTGANDTASASTPPASAVHDYTKAQSLQSAGHCDRALPLYLSAILKDSSYVNAYTSLAICYEILGAYNAGIAEYDKAIAIDPTNYGLYIGRAGIEAVSGNTGASTSDDAIALRLAPAQVPTYVSIAASFTSYGDFADAIQTMDKAIALVPDSSALYKQRADIYASAQDARHAYADYSRAISLTPNVATRASIYGSLANAYEQLQQDYNSAFSAMQSAIRLAPTTAAFYVQSGNIHRDAGANAAALGLYNQALRYAHKGPDAEAAHEGKGDVLAAIGQPRKAVDEYRLASRLTRDQGIRARIKSETQAVLSGQ